MLNYRLLSQMTSYDVASNTCQALGRVGGVKSPPKSAAADTSAFSMSGMSGGGAWITMMC